MPEKSSGPADNKSDVANFKKEEQKANKEWEEEKDTVSGVNGKIEKKLEDGTLSAEDLENTGG
ncbi:MAG: hypothetical protein JWQ27_1786 [Ferruginibacter sp.]|nr:hypothetical protein [Ferruginibacter sp.]